MSVLLDVLFSGLMICDVLIVDECDGIFQIVEDVMSFITFPVLS